MGTLPSECCIRAGGPPPHHKAPQEGWPQTSQEGRELGLSNAYLV